MSAFTEGNILQVLFVAILFDISLAIIGDRGNGALDFLNQISIAFFKLVAIVMKAAPIGAFGAMAFTIGAYGLGNLVNLALLVATFYFTALLFVLVILGAVARLAGFSILELIAYLKAELLLVLDTSSSESALPLLIEKMGAPVVPSRSSGWSCQPYPSPAWCWSSASTASCRYAAASPTPTNLVAAAPNISVQPAPRVRATLEYQRSWRRTTSDAVYRANGPAFAGTHLVDGRRIGGTLRAQIVWSISPRASFTGRYEHLRAGPALTQAGYCSSDFLAGRLSLRFQTGSDQIERRSSNRRRPVRHGSPRPPTPGPGTFSKHVVGSGRPSTPPSRGQRASASASPGRWLWRPAGLLDDASASGARSGPILKSRSLPGSPNANQTAAY